MTTHIIFWAAYAPMVSFASFISSELLVLGLFVLLLASCLIPDPQEKSNRRDV